MLPELVLIEYVFFYLNITLELFTTILTLDLTRYLVLIEYMFFYLNITLELFFTKVTQRIERTIWHMNDWVQCDPLNISVLRKLIHNVYR